MSENTNTFITGEVYRIRLQTGHYLLFQSFRRPQMITSKN